MSTATDVFELVNFFEQQNTSYEVDAHGHKNEPARNASHSDADGEKTTLKTAPKEEE